MPDPYSLDCDPTSAATQTYQQQIATALQSQQQQLATVMLAIYQQIDKQLTTQRSELVKVEKEVAKPIRANCREQQKQLDFIQQQIYADIASRITEQGVRLNLLQEQLLALEPTQTINQLPPVGVLAGQSVTNSASSFSQGGAASASATTPKSEYGVCFSRDLSQVTVVNENGQQTYNAGSQAFAGTINQLLGQLQGAVPFQQQPSIVSDTDLSTVKKVTVNYGPDNRAKSITVTDGGATNTYGASTADYALQLQLLQRGASELLPTPTLQADSGGAQPATAVAYTSPITLQPPSVKVDVSVLQQAPGSGVAAVERQPPTIQAEQAPRFEAPPIGPPTSGEQVVDPWLQPLAYRIGGFNERWKDAAVNWMGVDWSAVEYAHNWSEMVRKVNGLSRGVAQ